MTITTSRRQFLKGSAAIGTCLVVGIGTDGRLVAGGDAAFIPNPFVKITPDNTIIVIAKHFEMGQGTTTGLATLVAEELDASWDTVAVEWAPADTETYKNLAFGAQGTGGSTAIANSFMQYRQAGAAARKLLVESAATSWGVSPDEISTADSMLTHKSGKKATFGEMAVAAARLTLNEEPELKSEDQFKLIGKADLKRKDSNAKTDGTAKFALDVRLPGMVRVVIARPPRFGATVKSFKAEETVKVKGVLDVKQLPRGIAVYARSTWAAIKGREALEIEWDFSDADNRSTDELVNNHLQKLKEPGLEARVEGDANGALKKAKNIIEAQFKFPFLAHAPMETLNCVIKYDGKNAEIWDGCQFPSLAQPTAAKILGLKPEQVKINTVYAGGSFGRRANPTSDYVAEAAMAVKAIEGKWPVQLVWTREDDIRGGYYRPMHAHRIEAGLDDKGRPIAWRQRLAGKSIMKGTAFESALMKDGIDSTSVEGASTLPYKIPNLAVEIHNMEFKAPVLWWRSVGHTHTAFSTEIMIDMMAEAANADPVDYRMKLLADDSRLGGVLKLAAEKADWARKPDKGKARGVAVHKSFNSYVAEIVEISDAGDDNIKIDRVICAVDCGVVVNPDIVISQMEGGIGFALGAAMRNEITLTDGEVDQSNFPDYEPIRISDMPAIEVYIVPSKVAPTGVGEPGVPPAAPALANAIYALNGKRILSLPLSGAGISFA